MQNRQKDEHLPKTGQRDSVKSKITEIEGSRSIELKSSDEMTKKGIEGKIELSETHRSPERKTTHGNSGRAVGRPISPRDEASAYKTPDKQKDYSKIVSENLNKGKGQISVNRASIEQNKDRRNVFGTGERSTSSQGRAAIERLRATPGYYKKETSKNLAQERYHKLGSKASAEIKKDEGRPHHRDPARADIRERSPSPVRKNENQVYVKDVNRSHSPEAKAAMERLSRARQANNKTVSKKLIKESFQERFRSPKGKTLAERSKDDGKTNIRDLAENPGRDKSQSPEALAAIERSRRASQHNKKVVPRSWKEHSPSREKSSSSGENTLSEKIEDKDQSNMRGGAENNREKRLQSPVGKAATVRAMHQHQGNRTNDFGILIKERSQKPKSKASAVIKKEKRHNYGKDNPQIDMRETSQSPGRKASTVKNRAKNLDYLRNFSVDDTRQMSQSPEGRAALEKLITEHQENMNPSSEFVSRISEDNATSENISTGMSTSNITDTDSGLHRERKSQEQLQTDTSKTDIKPGTVMRISTRNKTKENADNITSETDRFSSRNIASPERMKYEKDTTEKTDTYGSHKLSAERIITDMIPDQASSTADFRPGSKRTEKKIKRRTNSQYSNISPTIGITSSEEMENSMRDRVGTTQKTQQIITPATKK